MSYCFLTANPAFPVASGVTSSRPAPESFLKGKDRFLVACSVPLCNTSLISLCSVLVASIHCQGSSAICSIKSHIYKPSFCFFTTKGYRYDNYCYFYLSFCIDHYSSNEHAFLSWEIFVSRVLLIGLIVDFLSLLKVSAVVHMRDQVRHMQVSNILHRQTVGIHSPLSAHTLFL